MRRRLAFLWFITALLVTSLFLWRKNKAPNHPPPVLKFTNQNLQELSSHQNSQRTYPSDGVHFFPLSATLCLRSTAQPTLTQLLPCIDEWIARGQACKSGSNNKMDVLWTWVNGSEPILVDTRRQLEASKPKGVRPAVFVGSRSTHFRTHDEMLYSMRSVLTALPTHLVGQYILLSADVAAEDTEELRLGSVPTWLNVDSAVRILHHSDVFRKPAVSETEARHWKDGIVPSFNSLAIESQIANVESLAPTLLYLNDDCFLLKALSAADFESPLFGPVFRIQFDLKVRSTPPDSVRMGVDREGEWPGLEHTNWLLDQRFGKRERRYLHHVAKVMSVPLMREVAGIWANELSTTAEARFRGHKPQVNLLYLTTWYTIEKHREALLYSFIMARADADGSGHFSAAERQILLDGLDSQEITINPRQDTQDVARNMKRAGLAPPEETEYEWLSSDGYPLIRTVRREHDSKTVCTLVIDTCFPREQTPLEIFRRVAFEKPDCGDCLIAHLINKSGPHGLAAFLPPAATTESSVALEPDLSKRWQDARFPSGMDRARAVNLIHRYSYAVGSTPIQFLALRRSGDVKRLPGTSSPVALLAVNDDLRNPQSTNQTDAAMGAWYRERWGDVRGWWEKME
ncbi:hypothetical protein FB45DRAFT_399046 [Roridomyces roridus]|uniref:Stealth protein CR3 conserved region 3 domain-containing protein n=1 Tax=Roridomyces roridus TaxID=1738132 RepID=A0AAD7C3K4_9AGAR|nr:hypothetical protein FB45DRAFT_399046 [Roridomyces roridus]